MPRNAPHRGKLAFALQAVDHGSRFARQHMQQAAETVGSRVGNRNAMQRQVLHQAQIKGKLLGGQALEQGQHIGTLVGGNKVIGVFNAPGAALHVLKTAQAQRLQKSAGLRKRDLCVNRHAPDCRGRFFAANSVS